jgi:hypothetical protein
MTEFFWRILAKIISHPRIVDWLIRYGQKTPYTHILSSDRQEVYMGRFWLFNPYTTHKKCKYWPFSISIRLHYIRRPDMDRHLHDHPWNARTIILRGGYTERRAINLSWPYANKFNHYSPGDTAKLKFGEYHRITEIAEGGVWTLFISGKFRGPWGFMVNGKKILSKDYIK